MNKKPLKLEFNKCMYVGCIPVEAHPTHPTDQSPCIVERCPHCNKFIWVSKNKRELREEGEGWIKIYCFPCLVVAGMVQNLETELIDIKEFE